MYTQDMRVTSVSDTRPYRRGRAEDDALALGPKDGAPINSPQLPSCV